MTIKKHKIQRGDSLIEVLVSVLILSVGLLGLAGLQVVGVKQNNASYMRTQAVYLSSQILDRVRANPNITYSSNQGNFPSSVVNCQTTQCTPAQLSSYDIAYWKCAFGTDYLANQVTCASLGVTQLLPNGRAQISRTGNLYQVSINWQDNTVASGNTTSFSVTTRI